MAWPSTSCPSMSGRTRTRSPSPSTTRRRAGPSGPGPTSWCRARPSRRCSTAATSGGPPGPAGSSRAGAVALHQFTPYGWFQPIEEALKPIYTKHRLDTKAHTEKTDALMAAKGYAKNGDGLWAKDGTTLAMTIYVPDWLKAYGPPLTE